MGSVDTHITDYDLQALVDNALDHEAHRRLMCAVKNDPRLWRRMEDLYYQRLILKEWWQTVPLA